MAARRSRTVGCTSRAKGRIWSRMIGVVSLKNGCVLRSAGARLRANGRSRSSAGPSSAASAPVFVSVCSVWSSAPGKSRIASRSEASSDAKASKFAFAESTSAASCLSRVRERGREDLEVVDHAPDVPAALHEPRRDLLAVAGRRLEALEDLAQVLRGGLLIALVGTGGLVVEGRAARVQQDLQVGARVGVELREELVAVHVRERVRHLHAPALGKLAGAACCRGRARCTCP